MIQKILAEIEIEVKYRIYYEQKNLTAVKNLKELVDQIDFNAEVVPLQDKNRLSKLLISLKGSELNENENEMIDQIMKNRN